MRGEVVLVNGEPVENVLVEPGEHVDEIAINIPTGLKVAYTLRFPIAYDGPISGSAVTVRGFECRTVGFSDHYRPRDVFGNWGGDWDMTVLVELIEGDMVALIEIVSVTASINELGYPSETESIVYSGFAQARMEDGSEKQGQTSEVDVSEIWHFVVPWQAAFSELRPQSTKIAYSGAEYDVSWIKNIDNASRHCDFMAVRRG